MRAWFGGIRTPPDPVDYETAAALRRSCRRSGRTVRKLVGCLIGAVALRHGSPVLHADTDFDVLARLTDLDLDVDETRR